MARSLGTNSTGPYCHQACRCTLLSASNQNPALCMILSTDSNTRNFKEDSLGEFLAVVGYFGPIGYVNLF